jgi:hypothetical protein
MKQTFAQDSQNFTPTKTSPTPRFSIFDKNVANDCPSTKTF